MLGACLSMAVIGEWLIVTLFGAAYQPAYPALLALLPGLLGLCYASILRLDLLGKNRPGTISLLMGLGALLNLALNLLLIPAYGIVGAAAASSIAYLAVTVAHARAVLPVERRAVLANPDHPAPRHAADAGRCCRRKPA